MRAGKYSSSEWKGPGSVPHWRIGFRLFPFLKSFIVPPKGQRILPTVTGYVLILMAIALGMAAYNSASNILFIALSLLLASLLVSGILSWVNFHGVCWRIVAPPHCRAGEECHVRIEVKNTKTMLPSYALNFVVEAQRSKARHVLRLGQRLEPQGVVKLDFTFTPEWRGRETIKIQGVISQFPFGFLRKTLAGGEPEEMVVWPRRVGYRLLHPGGATAELSGRSLAKIGHGSEFINLRAYRQGDSHRQIHWKASARLRNLVVQQFAAENQAGFILSVQTSTASWPDEEQFEHFCSFVSSLAEDLFRLERLRGARVNAEPHRRISRGTDLEFFQNQLSILDRLPSQETGFTPPGDSVITFEPTSGTGINAYVGGQKAATA